MRDRLFFPLAGILASAFVLMALQPWAERIPSGPASCGQCQNPEDKTIEGMELHRFVPGNYNGLSILTPADGGPLVLRISRMPEEDYQNPLSGPHIVLDSDLEFAFEDRPIEITIVARSVGELKADRFEADYYAKADNESGWTGFDLTREFAPYTFRYSTPSYGGLMSYDYLAIRPVAPAGAPVGDGSPADSSGRRTMEVQSIRIRAVGPKKTH